MRVHWCIADGIAWVGDDDRIALIDTGSAHAPPMLVPPVFADLWRLLAQGPVSESELCSRASELVHDDGPDLVQAFVDSLSGVGAIETVDVDR
ncbi:hypothetical protein [Janibacter sp. GS2]|uniref:hypothetical protein n=1 Tax=Janibacter sp. GS2 TaxID=3442646 RepID=UPI003EBD31B6